MYMAEPDLTKEPTLNATSTCATCGQELIWVPHLPHGRWVWIHSVPSRCQYPEPLVPPQYPSPWEGYVIEGALWCFVLTIVVCIAMFIW
jgi:hypothetical protein